MSGQTTCFGGRTALTLTPADASRTLSGWGFLVQPDLPDQPGPAFLLVALREQPELTHYDPEAIEFWVQKKGIGQRSHLTRDSMLPIDRDYAWGTIQIVDRRHVTNEYLTFGGHLSAAMVDGVVIAVFTSPAPILRRGGHSQGWDDAAENVGAFFGRAKIVIDYTPGFETRFGDLTPEVRYATFIADLVHRYRAERPLREAHPRLWQLAVAEERRLSRETPADWASARELMAEFRPV